jgi:SAM-dependent methyltransferase
VWLDANVEKVRDGGGLYASASWSRTPRTRTGAARQSASTCRRVRRLLLDWVRARFGVTLRGGVGFRAIAELVGSRVEYRRMDALDVHELGERFDVTLCLGILHRVTNPIALLRALADVLTPGGEIVLETYGSRLPADAPAIEVHEPGDVYARDEFVYWGFSPEGLRRLARIVGLDEVEVVDELEIDGHPRILAVLRAAG